MNARGSTVARASYGEKSAAVRVVARLAVRERGKRPSAIRRERFRNLTRRSSRPVRAEPAYRANAPVVRRFADRVATLAVPSGRKAATNRFVLLASDEVATAVDGSTDTATEEAQRVAVEK
jgi:hypothetical protein